MAPGWSGLISRERRKKAIASSGRPRQVLSRARTFNVSGSRVAGAKRATAPFAPGQSWSWNRRIASRRAIGSLSGYFVAALSRSAFWGAAFFWDAYCAAHSRTVPSGLAWPASNERKSHSRAWRSSPRCR